MSQPPGDPFGYFTPPPSQGPYGAPAGFSPPEPFGSPYTYAQQGTTPPLASAGNRLLARILDSVIVAVISAPVAGPLLLRYFQHISDKIDASVAASQAGTAPPNVYDSTTIRLLLMITTVTLLVSFLYEVPQLAIWGQTLGKRMCGIRVVQRDSLARPGFGKALVRWLVYVAVPNIPLIGSPFALVNSLWLLWDRPWRQCLHDKAAATIVIAVR